ncbi:CinA family nicotinamide mononucleotide deamidase-related protein [Candidatus Paraluminiphilus aquimaris]|uniref:CinA-like protein n=1 Tax=Candidatus Paraluminiphilus aquimaris TaxID=2518994 RepID=A0ABY6Q413_9GAMM|nr:CinA family nicotinamide mononucleotide deamidase-related protein [Candidatus Paraluminiphilus aquimaris]UZP74012.1 CinA family nicotinamide mononucleotide deamidase-related protein [Candidatus Paraluminiphilus aquimaris]
MSQHKKVALLLTGNELMSGDTVDSNSSRIAIALGERQIAISKKITVGDDQELLRESLRALCQDAGVVIINGGLGPTEDDLTADVVADVLGERLTDHPKAIKHLEEWCEKRGLELNASNLKQALLPESADIVDNPIGSAVGFAVEIGESLVITTPGVPVELTAMLPEIGQRVAQRVGSGTTYIRRLQTFGIGESTIQELVNERNQDWPEGVVLGFRSGLPQLELKLQVDDEALLEKRDQAEQLLLELIGDHVIGEDSDQLAMALQRVLVEKRMTLTTAESCTGGLIASLITKEAGSSQVFGAGFVTYANTAKQQVLHVSEDTINSHGAVSEGVVRAMLLGALTKANADIGIAVSGVAGPGGGSEDKPVGTVWLAWGTKDNNDAIRLQIPGSRERFQILVAAIGLDLMRRQLLELPPIPHYIKRFVYRSA